MFEKYTNINFHKKYVLWERNCTMRTDRRLDKYEKANSRFSQLCESA